LRFGISFPFLRYISYYSFEHGDVANTSECIEPISALSELWKSKNNFQFRKNIVALHRRVSYKTASRKWVCIKLWLNYRSACLRNKTKWIFYLRKESSCLIHMYVREIDLCDALIYVHSIFFVVFWMCRNRYKAKSAVAPLLTLFAEKKVIYFPFLCYSTRVFWLF
jgi:hypothetical protein